MLHFFRRHQKIFFIFITVIIIISFSVFGGRGTPQAEDPVAFKTIGGESVRRSTLYQMAFFLGSDIRDHASSGGAWGNPLNDGVVRHDFFSTGLAQILSSEYRDLLEEELQQKVARERVFEPYVHPHASYLSATYLWNYLAPAIPDLLSGMRGDSDPLSESAFNRRVALYLTEQECPQNMLKQVIRYQETQTGNVQPDSLLPQRDLSLYGYHTVEDWFGRNFMTLVCETIINGSVIAQEAGYRVSDEEAWSDLQRHAHAAFEQSKGSPHMTASDAGQFLQQSLRNMGLDRNSATKTWKQVLMFRRLFHDVGSSSLVDAFALSRFHNYASESSELKVASLPEAMHLRGGRDLQLFEIYLDRVAKGSDGAKLPTEFRDLSDLPEELVYRPYTLDVAQVGRSSLTVEIPLAELWSWELEEKNWALLLEKYPSLGECDTREARFEVLQACDGGTRQGVDALAQRAILDDHPEWITAALEIAPMERKEIKLSLGDGNTPLPGVSDKADFMALLDGSDALNEYSPDGRTFYRIEVVERGDANQAFTFAEAREAGALDILLERQLKSFQSKVADATADTLFKPRYNQIFESLPARTQKLASATPEFCALHRFHQHLTNGENGPEGTLADQWRLEERTITVKRSDRNRLGGDAAFELAIGARSDVMEPGDRSPYRFEVISRAPGDASEAERTTVRDALRGEAQRNLMAQVLEQIKQRGEKHAEV
jgi:GcvH upstream region-like protein